MKKKGFIERLTDEQIRKFISAVYKKYSFSFTRGNGRIIVAIDDGSYASDSIFYLNLREFDASGAKVRKDWVNYLYSIFGEEYNRAYKKYIFQKHSLLIDKE